MRPAGLGTFGRLVQGRSLALQLVHPRLQALQRGFVEPGANAPGITQAILAIHRQEQGAETAAAALGAGVADDHELLAQAALELDPVGAAP
ncbi:hypothetical protein FQZ97_841620 [compost metagenome]